MPEKPSHDEVAIIINARKILNERGFNRDADVKEVCEAAGISRKTGYEWAGKMMEGADSEVDKLRKELAELKAAHKKLQKRLDDVNFENEGRKIAWEIHEVDKLLAEKKSTMERPGKQRR